MFGSVLALVAIFGGLIAFFHIMSCLGGREDSYKAIEEEINKN